MPNPMAEKRSKSAKKYTPAIKITKDNVLSMYFKKAFFMYLPTNLSLFGD